MLQHQPFGQFYLSWDAESTSRHNDLVCPSRSLADSGSALMLSSFAPQLRRACLNRSASTRGPERCSVRNLHLRNVIIDSAYISLTYIDHQGTIYRSGCTKYHNDINSYNDSKFTKIMYDYVWWPLSTLLQKNGSHLVKDRYTYILWRVCEETHITRQYKGNSRLTIHELQYAQNVKSIITI